MESVPIEIVQLWRVLVWAAELALLGSVVAFLPRAWSHRRLDELMPRWTLSLYMAVAVWLIQDAVQQAVRWDDPLRVEGLPLTTVAVVLCICARVERGRERIS